MVKAIFDNCDRCDKERVLYNVKSMKLCAPCKNTF